MRRPTILILACLTAAGVARAADQPISAAKLLLIRSGAGEKLVFVSRNPAFLFPAVGGADGPGTGTPGGLQIDLFSPAEPMGASLMLQQLVRRGDFDLRLA